VIVSSPSCTANLPLLSRYIHGPWCVRKCARCDFNVYHAPDTAPQFRYTAALLAAPAARNR